MITDGASAQVKERGEDNAGLMLQCKSSGVMAVNKVAARTHFGKSRLDRPTAVSVMHDMHRIIL